MPRAEGPDPRSGPIRDDPVDRAGPVDLLRHEQVCALQHALGDPERDPVDEEALPQLERGGRSIGEARKVRQVAPERLPALRLELRLRAPPPPEPPAEGRGDPEQQGVGDEARADGDQDDVAPPRGDGAEAVNADDEQHDAGNAEQGGCDPEHGGAAVIEPALGLHRRGDALLERGEALGVLRPILLDPVAEARQPLGPALEDRRDDSLDRLLERRDVRQAVTHGELEVGHVLVTEAAPRRPRGRHGNRLESPPADQVEERRRELVRARLAALAQ